MLLVTQRVVLAGVPEVAGEAFLESRLTECCSVNHSGQSFSAAGRPGEAQSSLKVLGTFMQISLELALGSG